jgi:hypothetical protein
MTWQARTGVNVGSPPRSFARRFGVTAVCAGCGVLLALAAAASGRPVKPHTSPGASSWRIYRISMRWSETLQITTISTRDQGDVDCNVDVTTNGSARSYYIGTSTAANDEEVLAATTPSAVPGAPFPPRFTVPGRLTITVGHTTCADGSAPPVDCAGTYGLPIVVQQFDRAQENVTFRKAMTTWTFGYRPATQARSRLPRGPKSCHDPAYSSLSQDVFAHVAAGSAAGPYSNTVATDVPRAKLLAGKPFSTKLAVPGWDADYERGKGTMTSWVSLVPVG